LGAPLLPRGAAAGARGMASAPLAVPKKLSDLVKLEALTGEPAGRIIQIWMEYHEGKDSALGAVLSKPENDVIAFRIKRAPMVIIPLKKGGGHLMMVAQFQDGESAIVTTLEEYKQNPAMATPHMCVSVYRDLLQTKELVLVRGDYHKTMLSAEEAKGFVQTLFKCYVDTNYFKHVQLLNGSPGQFVWEEYMALFEKAETAPEDAGKAVNKA